MEGDTMIYAAGIMGALAMMCAIYVFFPRTMLDLGEDLSQVEAHKTGIFWLITPFLAMLMPITSSFRSGAIEKYRQDAARKLVMGGLEDQVKTEEYMAMIPLAGIAGAALGGFIGFIFLVKSGDMGKGLMMLIGMPLFCGLIGMVYPDSWLSRNVRMRQKKIFRALPYTLDLLTVSVEAGLDFLGGLQRVSRQTPQSPLREEISRMLQQMQLGKTRVEVLQQMKERVNMPDMTSVVTALIQATLLGASLGPVLRLQSDMLRTKRSQIAETLANEAPVKMLFPLLIFIFPSIFIVILGPIFIKHFAKM
ncbi:type II secretion system F family protein [Candidatus Sumerlaeota bacterium]|nr:type II secretion system F family protein [Candidatus Sumerlaeota bacterium]